MLCVAASSGSYAGRQNAMHNEQVATFDWTAQQVSRSTPAGQDPATCNAILPPCLKHTAGFKTLAQGAGLGLLHLLALAAACICCIASCCTLGTGPAAGRYWPVCQLQGPGCCMGQWPCMHSRLLPASCYWLPEPKCPAADVGWWCCCSSGRLASSWL